jgi:methylmalonyl-CoA/ethylmalonyl-CoA epimerase
MKQYGLRFHHLGLAVSEPQRAIRFLGGLGYDTGVVTYDALQQVNLMMCRHHDMPDVEVIFPGETPGPIDKLLAVNGECVYHLCYETDNLQIVLAEMQQDNNRLICISHPKPAVLFANRQVSFYAVRGFGLIEILEGP